MSRSKEKLKFVMTFWRANWHFQLCHYRWGLDLPIQPWETTYIKNCKFFICKKVSTNQIKSQKNAADFCDKRIVYYVFIPTWPHNEPGLLLERLCEKVGSNQPELLASSSWICGTTLFMCGWMSWSKHIF